MKVKVPLALLVLLAVAVGYLLGTEAGRERREQLLVRIGTAKPVPDNGGGETAAADETVDAG